MGRPSSGQRSASSAPGHPAPHCRRRQGKAATGLQWGRPEPGCSSNTSTRSQARRYNETADELAKIASGRTTVPPDVFSQDLYQPSIKTDDTPETKEALAQPEAPSAPEGEALRVEEERNGVTPSRNWQTSYL